MERGVRLSVAAPIEAVSTGGHPGGGGDPKATLGEVVKRNPDLLPKPLDTALSQLWDYASNGARHVQEGREPAREEAELLVGLAAVLATYLTRK